MVQKEIDGLKKTIKQARQHIRKAAKELPNSDAYARPYSILADLAEAIDTEMKELSPALKEADKLYKKNPDQGVNRARNWCRKP